MPLGYNCGHFARWGWDYEDAEEFGRSRGDCGAARASAGGERAAVGEDVSARDGVPLGRFVSRGDGGEGAGNEAGDIWARVHEMGGAVFACAVAAWDSDDAGDGSGARGHAACGILQR